MSAPPEATAPNRVADVRAGAGAAWLAQGFHFFRRQPGTWIGLAVGWLVISFGVLMVPLVGIVAFYFLQPVFFASFALAARRQLAGERIELGDLFNGFRGNVRALLNLGAIDLFIVFVLSISFALLGMPEVMDSSGKMLKPDDIVQQLKGKEWVLVLGLAVLVVQKGALWFAPAIVAFHGVRSMHAVRWSVYAALSNVGAMIVYGIALTLLMFVAMLPWLLGLLVAIPVMAASTYAGYRDVFEQQ